MSRPDPAIRSWQGSHELAPGVTLLQLGGHFEGSAVIHWAQGAGGKGVLLASDTIQSNPDRETVTFMRSFPNRIPLSLRSSSVSRGRSRAWRSTASTTTSAARSTPTPQARVRRSAERYAAWAGGDHDELHLGVAPRLQQSPGDDEVLDLLDPSPRISSGASR